MEGFSDAVVAEINLCLLDYEDAELNGQSNLVLWCKFKFVCFMFILRFARDART